MPTIEKFEAVVIGGGKAGKTLAADLGQAGIRVALIERGMIGGTCVNVGCIPSKALIRCADVASVVARSSRFGVVTPNASVDMSAVQTYKRSVVAGLVEVNGRNLQQALDERFILGDARFIGPRTVEVRPAGGGPERVLSGDNVFLNVGAVPVMPPVPGLLETKPLTSDTALELDRVPRHLLVMGGGYIGVELGQAFRRLGSEVTIVQRAASLLPDQDDDVSDAVQAILLKDGIEILTSSSVVAATGRSGQDVQLTIEGLNGPLTRSGSDVLVAVGRAPLTRDLGLEFAGVDTDAGGFIRVNEHLETTAPQTWAMGDCAGSPQHTHVALDDFRIIRANVFGNGGRTTADRLIPKTVFIDPELGQVGLTEKDARRLNRPAGLVKIDGVAIPRARTFGDTRGFQKAVIEPGTGRILGFAMLGPGAGEVTAAVQFAMLGGLPYTALRDAVIAHPTMAEGLNALFASNLRPI